MMPEVGNEYIHASVMLQCGSQMMQGTAIACKQDQDGNPISCRSDNLIIDTHLYQVEFPDGELVPLTANDILQSIYA